MKLLSHGIFLKYILTLKRHPNNQASFMEGILTSTKWENHFLEDALHSLILSNSPEQTPDLIKADHLTEGRCVLLSSPCSIPRVPVSLPSSPSSCFMLWTVFLCLIINMHMFRYGHLSPETICFSLRPSKYRFYLSIEIDGRKSDWSSSAHNGQSALGSDVHLDPFRCVRTMEGKSLRGHLPEEQEAAEVPQTTCLQL